MTATNTICIYREQNEVLVQSGYILALGAGRVNGAITSLNNTVDTTVTVGIYNNSNVLQGDLLCDTTYSFTANTSVTLQDIKGDTLSFTAPSTTGEYYIELTIGTETLYIRFTVLPLAPEVLSPSISDTSITKGSSVVISCIVSAITDEAFVQFNDASGNPVYAKQMLITGTTATCTTDPGLIPVDVYGAGDIIIYALDNASPQYFATDETLTLTVTTDEGLRSGALRWLRETVYIKYETGVDDNGYTTYGDWTATSARIERTTQKVLDGNGIMVTSTAQIYVSGDNDVGIMDRVKFANDFSTTAEARIIRVNTLSNAAGADEVKVIFT